MREVKAPFPEVLDRTERALADQGFGIVTRIDMRATLKEKIGAEIPPYVVLGACNPKLAHRAIGIEPRVGLVLPCNVVVRERDDGEVVVEAMEPEWMAELFPEAPLSALASEVGERLRRALDAI